MDNLFPSLLIFCHELVVMSNEDMTKDKRLSDFLLPITCCLLSLTFGVTASATSAVNPYQASKYRELGLLYQQQQRYSEAIATMKKSVALAPQNIIGRVNLGWTQHLAGQESAAAESLLQAAYRDPYSVPTFNALGIVYLVGGDLTSAVTVHTWAAMLKADNEIAYYNLSLSYHRLRQYAFAAITANIAAQLEPTNPHPFVALAIAHWDGGERNRSMKAYRLAFNLDSRYSDRAFLGHLKKAGFSREQIQTAEQVLSVAAK